jgi:hypothetical protein
MNRSKTTPSDLAAIVDSYGGFRVVVAPARTFCHHLRPGEMLFQVPGFKIREPVPWGKIPWVIATARKRIEWWIQTRNDPADLELEPIKLYRLRQLRAFHHCVDLTEIAET